uniref:Uncharacterized protein n=1 Tax=Nelumbo nucifera TaxID=4432 RepID=A0A822ZVQ6_NELNU|nr:TPA_asm: hypothetical protein HUJ06_016903 [Nelumbo nucifera]
MLRAKEIFRTSKLLQSNGSFCSLSLARKVRANDTIDFMAGISKEGLLTSRITPGKLINNRLCRRIIGLESCPSKGCFLF